MANRIAAGEVVERPASVVKELVENSLDAGASQVEVEVQGDGTRLIRVVDDGCGMDGDDALLCLERHATSKLGDDLFAIRTFGFRGEAIPSIASVSLFTVITRPAEVDLGTRIEVRYGTVTKVHETGCPAGTVIEVRNLFGNQPARRKFLKSRRTELAHIDEVVRAAALANPQVAFRLTVDGRVSLQLATPDPSPAARFHRLVAGSLSLPLVSVTAEEENFRLEGVLLAPEEAAATRLPLRIFVNGRPVRDFALARAVADGGRGFFMKGRRPAGIVLLSIDPSLVDVNVHPTKQEVRFRHPGIVFQALSRAVQRGLVAYQRDHKGAAFAGIQPQPERPSRPDPLTDLAAPARSRRETPIDRTPFVPPSPEPISSAAVTALGEPPAIPADEGGKYGAVESRPAAGVAGVPQEERGSGRPGGMLADAVSDGLAAPREPVRVIGQLFDSYILCQSGDAFIVIDQHAAQERLLYEKLRRQYLNGGVHRQVLLFPAVIELDADRLQLVEQFGDELERCGVVVREFGGRSVLVSELPALLGPVEPAAVLADLLDRFAAGGGGEGMFEAVLANLACKAAIKAHHRLQPEESEELVRQMLAADIFSHCPHGRPVLKRFDRQAVARWFFRT